MSRRNEASLILFIIVMAYMISSYIHKDQRIFRIEDYYGRVPEAEAFLSKLHPEGSSLEMFRYTMELSGMELRAEKATPDKDETAHSLAQRFPKMCCVIKYRRPVNIFMKGIFKNGVIYGMYNEDKKIVHISVGYYGGI